MNATAKIKTIAFANADTGFCFLVLDINGQSVRAHGRIANPKKNETIQVAGSFVRHEHYGWSIQAVFARDEIDAHLAARGCSLATREARAFVPGIPEDWPVVGAVKGMSKAEMAVEAARIFVEPLGLPLDRLVEKVANATGVEPVEARPAIAAAFVVTPKGNVVTKAMIDALKNSSIPRNEPRTAVDSAQFHKIVAGWSSPTLLDSEKAAVVAAINSTSIVVHHPSAARAQVIREAVAKLAIETKTLMPFLVVTDIDVNLAVNSNYLGLIDSGWIACHRCEWTPVDFLGKCLAGAANGVPVFAKRIADGAETSYGDGDDAILVETKNDDETLAEIRTLITNDDTVVVSPAPYGPYSPGVLNRRIHERDDDLPIVDDVYHGDLVISGGKWMRVSGPVEDAEVANVATLEQARLNPGLWDTVVVVIPEAKISKTWIYSAMKLARKRVVVVGSGRAVSSIIKTSVVPRNLAAEMLTKG